MKAYVYNTGGMYSNGKTMESENLEKLCNYILDTHDFGKFEPEIVVSKPNMNLLYDEKAKQCDWVIEIYDDYRE